MTQKIRRDLREIRETPGVPTIYKEGNTGTTNYDQKRRLSNLRFDHKPATILMCQCTKHVIIPTKLAQKYQLKLRVKSGENDYESESSATDCILINFQKIKNFSLDEITAPDSDEKLKVARIAPCWIFKEIVKEHLDPNNISIPHGTCGTVGDSIEIRDLRS